MRVVCTKRGPWVNSFGDSPLHGPSFGEELEVARVVDGGAYLGFLEYDGASPWDGPAPCKWASRWFADISHMEAEIASLLEEQLETA